MKKLLFILFALMFSLPCEASLSHNTHLTHTGLKPVPHSFKIAKSHFLPKYQVGEFKFGDGGDIADICPASVYQYTKDNCTYPNKPEHSCGGRYRVCGCGSPYIYTAEQCAATGKEGGGSSCTVRGGSKNGTTYYTACACPSSYTKLTTGQKCEGGTGCSSAGEKYCDSTAHIECESKYKVCEQNKSGRSGSCTAGGVTKYLDCYCDAVLYPKTYEDCQAEFGVNAVISGSVCGNNERGTSCSCEARCPPSHPDSSCGSLSGEEYADGDGCGGKCYKCNTAETSCKEQLEAAGYGVDGVVGSNGTSVITKDVSLTNFADSKKYISLKGLSFSQCKYTTKPTVTLTQHSPSMSSVGMDNLNVNGSGSIVLNGTATVKDVDFNFSYLDISDANNATARIKFEGSVKLPGSKLTVYPRGDLTVMNDFYADNGIEIRGTVGLAYAATFKTPKDITINQSANLDTEFSGPNTKGTVTAKNIISSGYIDFYRKNVEVSGDVLLSSSGDASFCNRRSRPGDCLLSLSASTLKANAIYVRDGGQFESSSSTTTLGDALLAYKGGSVTLTSSDLTAYKIYSTVDGGKFEIHGGNVKATYETAVGWNWENGTELANEYATIRMDKGAVFTLPDDAMLKLYNGGRLCYIGDARFYFAGKGKYYCADKDCKYTNTTNYRGAGVGRKDGWRTITNKKAGGNWNDNRGTCTGKN